MRIANQRGQKAAESSVERHSRRAITHTIQFRQSSLRPKAFVMPTAVSARRARLLLNSQMREIILIGIVMTVMLAGIVAWAAPRHPAVVTSQFDTFPLEENAKNLPTQEWLNAHMWPNNTT